MTTKQEQIQIILKDMDFEKIHNVMNFLDWTWTNSESGEKIIPDVNELSANAELCMNKAIESDFDYFNSGGFECEIIEGAIELKFVIEKINPLSRLFG